MLTLRGYQQIAVNESMAALKLNDNPVLLECSVGGGKSLLCGSIARKLESVGKRVLCLVSSSELVRSNSQAFRDLGGNPSVFCTSLDDKSCDQLVVFATPQSVIAALKTNHPIASIVFNLIIVDEAHQINPHNDHSTYLRILRHYRQEYKNMRVLGMTGTAFRGSTSITGTHAFFKTKVGNISTQYLIEQNFLVPPVFGYTKIEGFDFSKCKAQNTGEFKGRELQAVIDSKKRLTYDILQEVQEIMKHRTPVMIFCSTRAHCFEALTALPADECRIILGSTPSDERNKSLNLSRAGRVKWLLSVNCLLTGINITNLGGIVWLRPTSSLLLYIQGIGRGLRLHDGKKDCLILDYSGNLDRFQDFDNPIINAAIQPKPEEEQDYVIKCYTCNTMNSIHARRCRGMPDNKRCDYYFEFKDCKACGQKNDTTARQCRDCETELIDPNAKLSLKDERLTMDVLRAEYWLNIPGYGKQILTARYITSENTVFESYVITERSKNIVYGNFIKKHTEKPSEWYPHILNHEKMREMMYQNPLYTPNQIVVKPDEYGRMKLVKKIFYNE